MTKAELQHFAEAVRMGRAKLNLNKMEFCKRAGLTPNTLRALERGTQHPNPETVNHIARLLGTTVPALTHGKRTIEPHEASAMRHASRHTRNTGPWGEAIQALLNERNMRQADLVKAAQMRPTTVSRITRGFDTNTKLLKRIAQALGVPLDRVLVPPLRSDRQELERSIDDVLRRSLLEVRITRKGGDNDAP